MSIPISQFIPPLLSTYIVPGAPDSEISIYGPYLQEVYHLADFSAQCHGSCDRCKHKVCSRAQTETPRSDSVVRYVIPFTRIKT